MSKSATKRAFFSCCRGTSSFPQPRNIEECLLSQEIRHFSVHHRGSLECSMVSKCFLRQLLDQLQRNSRRNHSEPYIFPKQTQGKKTSIIRGQVESRGKLTTEKWVCWVTHLLRWWAIVIKTCTAAQLWSPRSDWHESHGRNGETKGKKTCTWSKYRVRKLCSTKHILAPPKECLLEGF